MVNKKDDRSTLNMSRHDREELVDKAFPRVVAEVGRLLSIQECTVALLEGWWERENIKSLFPEEYSELKRRMEERLPRNTDRMPYTLPSASKE